MPRAAFRGGIHPHTEKEPTQCEYVEAMPPPPKVVIPLSQHTGAPCRPLVKVGDAVRAGDLIADSDSFVSAFVHASITGKVTAVDTRPHPWLGESQAVIIEREMPSEASMEPDYDSNFRPWHDMEPGELRAIVRDAGIVGLGGAAFPTHVKLSPPEGRTIHTVLLNGAECEPYLTADERVMIESPAAVIEGARIICHVLGANRCVIAMEDNKPLAAKALRNTLAEEKIRKIAFEIRILPTRYPQGSEKQLIFAVAGKEVPSGGLPMDVGIVVHNVGTAAAIYDAVVKKKPLYERIVTLAGSCLHRQGNFRVRIGTSIAQLVEYSGGFASRPVKVLQGGPMMGIAQYTLEVPVVKGTTGIVFLSESDIPHGETLSCIRCGRCVESCPMGLIPAAYALYGKKGKFEELRDDYRVMDCIECGCCAWRCPSSIPLVQWIKLAKQQLRKAKT